MSFFCYSVLLIFVLKLFMCATFTFICLIPVDYDNETDDVDQNGILISNRNSNNNNSDGDDDDNVGDDDDNNNVQQPATDSTRPVITDDATSDSSLNRINEQIDTNEIDGSETQPTEQPTEQPPPAVIENRNKISIGALSCDLNNGGCEQTCNMVPDAQSGENVVECSCTDGFYLDADGGTNCLGES